MVHNNVFSRPGEAIPRKKAAYFWTFPKKIRQEKFALVWRAKHSIDYLLRHGISKKAYRGKVFRDKILPESSLINPNKKVITGKNHVNIKIISLLVTIIGVNFPLTYLSWVLIRATFFQYSQTFVDTMTAGS